MITPEVPMIGLSLGKHFDQSYTRPLIWYSIIHPNRMLNCKIPKVNIISPMLFPMLWRVYHKRASRINNGLDSAFRSCIFMLSPNCRETMGLALSFAIIVVFICHKHTVITIVMGDLGTCLFLQALFNLRFSQHIFIFSKLDLILNPNQTRRSIITDVTAVKLILSTFATISRWKSSRRAHKKLICVNKVFYFILVTSEYPFLLRYRFDFSPLHGVYPMILIQSARCAWKAAPEDLIP